MLFPSILKICALYPFYLYCNFSGYIDIVIPIARLMRIELPENFNRPFSATSFIEFWSRWHITLSSWLKRYVYNPLLIQMMRWDASAGKQAVFGVSCFFITFFLVGVWHGRTSEFVFFGFLQGAGVALNKIWQLSMSSILGRKRYKKLAKNVAYVALTRGLTFSWFAFSLIWFWADWKQAGTLFLALNLKSTVAVWVLIWVVASVALAAWEKIREMLLSIGVGGNPLLTGATVRAIYAMLLSVVAYFVTAEYGAGALKLVYKAF